MSKRTPIWQNRIIGYFEKPANQFKANSLNWKIHSNNQRLALSGVLSEIGWVTGVIENRQSGNLLDGHARIEEALSKNPEMLIPYLQVDLSEEEERKILAVLDPIGNLAQTDADKLFELKNLLQFDDEILSGLLDNLTVDLTVPDFKEFTEEVEKEVEYLECPKCQHRFPK